MSKNTNVFRVLLLVLVFSGGLLARGGVPDLTRHMRPGIGMAERVLFSVNMLLKYKDEIGLTSSQIEKIEGARTTTHEAHIRGRADIRVLELKFADLLKAGKVDRSAMEKLAREIGRKKTDLYLSNLNYLLDVKAMLTAEQIQKAESLRKKDRRDRRGRREMRDRGRGGRRT